MKKAFVVSLAVWLTLGAFSSVQAQEEGWITPIIEADVAFNSKYIWRGQNLGDDFVVQPSVTLGGDMGDKGALSLNIWGNYDTDSEDITEVDYTVDYTLPVGEYFSVSVGYILFQFPQSSGDDEFSHEVYGALGLEIPITDDIALSTALSVNHDFEDGDGAYYNLGVSTGIPIKEFATVDLGASVGYNDGQWGYDPSFADCLLSAGLSIPIGDHVTLAPGVNYSVALDDQYDDEFFAGVSLSVAF